jgi:hypothetical protein
MTSCLLVKSDKRVVAVADGRLSRDDQTSTFNSTRKLVEFPISYKIPQFRSGWFDGYSEYRSHPWFVAYAGTHTVTTEIIDLFRQRIDSLFLTRETPGRTPALADHFDTSCHFSDDYSFGRAEMPPITARDVLQELEAAFEIRGSEFSETRRERPDSQYLLFGNEEATGDYKAFILSADENGYFPGSRLGIKVKRVANGELATIGSPVVAATAYENQQLMRGVAGWKTDLLTDPTLTDLDELAGNEAAAFQHSDDDAWQVDRVAKELSQIISSTSDPSVGGQIMVAHGDWGKQIYIQVIDAPEPKS